jgi:putative membrane protein insertion efficiency factor
MSCSAPSISAVDAERSRSTAGRWAAVAVQAYRLVLRPLLSPACRFHPSCSEFAIEAFETHGIGAGTRLTLGRLVRCHPWHPGGYDPVPVRKS